MKFSPWQLVAILAILMGAIVVVHIFAPTAIATVTSMAAALFAALFINRGDPPGGPPSLKVISGGVAMLALSFLTSCSPPKPAAYADELRACLDNSTTWEEYTPCCERAAAKYDRDPGFCREQDGGL